MIFNEIKCHVNTSLGLVGGCIPCSPTPVSAPGYNYLGAFYLTYFARVCEIFIAMVSELQRGPHVVL